VQERSLFLETSLGPASILLVSFQRELMLIRGPSLPIEDFVCTPTCLIVYEKSEVLRRKFREFELSEGLKLYFLAQQPTNSEVR
jgi:hypothetical protein